MAFSVCVVILSSRRRPLTLNISDDNHKRCEKEEKPLHFKKCQRKKWRCKEKKIDWLTGCLFIYLFIWWRKLEQVRRRRGRGDMIHWGDGDMRLFKSFQIMMDVWDWVSRCDWSGKSFLLLLERRKATALGLSQPGWLCCEGIGFCKQIKGINMTMFI